MYNDSNVVVHPSSGREITYKAIRDAMKGEPWRMELVGPDEKKAVVAAVNRGIDAHLEACYCPVIGDSYRMGERSITATEDTKFWKAGEKLVLATPLVCVVSPASLPVLLRRLTEQEYPEDSEADGLVSSILEMLGFNDYGEYVGREED